MDIFDSRSAQAMLIQGETDPFDSPDYVFELKLDGERCLAYLDGKQTELINKRQRRVLPQFPELAQLHQLTKKRCIIDGELIIGQGSKQDFELLKQRALTKRDFTIRRLSAENPCTFVAVDIIYLHDKPVTSLPLTERQALMHKTLRENDHLVHSRIIDTYGKKYYELVSAQGLEGVIAKKKTSIYQMGKRTREWHKIKNWESGNFIVCGYVVSDHAHVASLVLGQYNQAREMVYKGRVTLGLARESFKLIASQPKVKTHPFNGPVPDGSAGATWIKPSLVCSVGFMCWTVNMRLRQPFFKEMRPDVRPDTIFEPSREKAGVC